LIKQPVMDPAYVSVADYAKAVSQGASFPEDRITPPKLIDMLERDNREALRLVAKIGTAGNESLKYEVADVKAWANLGLHLAAKLRGAVALQRFRLNGDARQQAEALEHLQRALGFWDELIRITRPVYRDMKLTHYNGNSFNANPDNLFHWERIRAEVAADIDMARQ
jgi:hypothetical protein